MRGSWRLGRWRGVPISLHWTVLIGLPWFYYETRSFAGTATAFVAFFFLILIHELGHAAVARWRGVEVESIRLFFIHGTCSTEEPPTSWMTCSLRGAALRRNSSCSSSRSVRACCSRNLLPVAPFDGAKAWGILPILQEWWKQTSWAAGMRRRKTAREKARTKKLEAESERIAADIIDKLKKGKSDA